MTDEKKQHLEFIQSTINRMSSKSMQIKTIAITLGVGLLAVYSSNSNVFLIYIALFQICFFWLLDGYYLQQVRKFRGIYYDVSGVTQNNSIKDYEMPLHLYKNGKYNLFKCVFTFSKLLFFGSVTLVLSALIIGLAFIKF